MAQSDAAAFLRAMEQDEGLRERVRVLKGRDALTRMTEIAAEAGYRFSVAEYQAEVAAQAKGQLSPEALRETLEGMGFAPELEQDGD